MLTIEEIKKELDAGHEVELECVDREGFDDGLSSVNLVILNQDKLTVKSIDELSGIIYLHGDYIIARNNCIVSKEFKHFRIKRPTPTFNDLIDVVVQAAKDDLITIDKLDRFRIYICVHKTGEYKFYDLAKISDILDPINFINSLYTETFAIETQSDLSIIKLNDKKQKLN